MANKYHNRAFTCNGVRWDSEKEWYRYQYLLQAQKHGTIRNLERQVTFELLPAVTEEVIIQLKTKVKTKTKTVQLPVTYTCDFLYTQADGTVVIEDVKADPKMLPKEYVLKKKMMRALLGIKIREVYNATEKI